MLLHRVSLSYAVLSIILSWIGSSLAQTASPSSDELGASRTVLDVALDDPIAIIGKPASKMIEEWRTGDGNRVTRVRTHWGRYCLTTPINPPGFMRNDIGSSISLPTNCPQ